MGYRMSANADERIVTRCASTVKEAYLLHYVTNDDIAEAAADSVISKTWNALTFLCYCQDVEFGTRTGGEKKRFDYGDHVKEEERLKSDCALLLKALKAKYPEKSKIDDVCRVFFRTQFFY